MYAHVHLMQGVTICRELRRDGVPASRLLFVLGCIIPDFDPRTKSGTHVLRDALDEVRNFFRVEDTSLRRRSFQAGRVCHHVADCFSVPHLAPQVYNTRTKHMGYEGRHSSVLLREMRTHAAKDQTRRGFLMTFIREVQAAKDATPAENATHEAQRMMLWSSRAAHVLLGKSKVSV